MSDDMFFHLEKALGQRDSPLVLPWPILGNPAGFRTFHSPMDWVAAVADLSLDPRVPLVVRAKFARAQKVLLLSWLDPDLIKVSELVAFTALELALKDRLGAIVKHNKPPKRDFGSAPQTASLAALLDHLVSADGLMDADLPSIVRCGGTVVERFRLKSDARPSIAELRNEGAHGNPFDGFPQSELVELIRDVIHFAYRDHLSLAPPLAGAGMTATLTVTEHAGQVATRS